ncbi:MAG TPA: RraA family protein [Bryobacteraceae bacterium]|jgi:regulator of RNase E activity RraA|nr:RraA family protein [Bryobacteraceae bacterium]
MEWKNDEELFQLISTTLYTPVVGDILDLIDHRHQFLPQPIQPISADTRLVGRAMPVQIADVWGHPDQPFGRLTEALDQIQPGEVYIATGGSLNCAAWGEIMTAAARTRGGAGAVLDGFHRDTPRILEQNWPVFSRGRYAQDAAVRSRVLEIRVPIEIAAVRIRPGDLIFGDLDGVLVIPREAEEETITRALEKARSEKVVRREIEAGASTTEVFKKYGIL